MRALHAWLVGLPLAAALALAAPGAAAWGVRGHAAVARAAQAALSPQAQTEVAALLADDLDAHGAPSGRSTLAEVASWPDEIRALAPADRFKGWHVRGNSVCTGKAGGCKDGHCADQLIVHYAAVLADRSQELRARNEALKWVVHLVGDLHQPLHSGVAADHGNSAVHLTGYPAKARSLHQVWDSELAEAALREAPLQPVTRALPGEGVAEVGLWMEEARQLARSAVYAPIAGFACGAEADGLVALPLELDERYQAQARATARLQMQRAAQRLASVLEVALGSAP